MLAPLQRETWLCVLQEKNRALKYGCGTAALVGMGAFIPFFAAWFQIQKAKG